jgi:hypothetical protein
MLHVNITKIIVTLASRKISETTEIMHSTIQEKFGKLLSLTPQENKTYNRSWDRRKVVIFLKVWGENFLAKDKLKNF